MSSDVEIPNKYFKSFFTFGDTVFIDGDRSLKARVTGIKFRWRGEPVLELSWIINGDPKCYEIEESRCEHYE